ncbi:MAG: aminomethyl-transferring glycine dehydrogenase subunit GcvPA [Elusimicrobia bacterium]|nr:aminomethyl-transferring glycine dehydrogenase subunit GcvPA [Candidatus Obscuribacterium magneticum]
MTIFPTSTQDEQKLLAGIGVSSFESLLLRLPTRHLNPGLGLPKGLSELEVTKELEGLAGKNGKPLSFLGAGAYDHFIPAAVSSLVSRGEFLTAYTPYQPEASQGTLQTIFEFQSLVAELYGMEVANASLYDGASALAEAILVAIRHTDRSVVLLPDALHPHSRRTVETYMNPAGPAKLITVACPKGVIDMMDLDTKLSAHKNEVAAVVIQTPNFFGCLEDGTALSKKAHDAGALLIASANPLSLGLVAPPGEYDADIAVGEGQPLGLPLSFGGPYVGLFACKKEFMRKIPGRLCGQTLDRDGKVGYVLTLQAREQHIRREKATSNICTNQNLCATAFAIHASLLGPEGLRELAELNLQIAHYAAQSLANLPGFKLTFAAPFFNEFVLELPLEAEAAHKKLLDLGIVGGLPLKSYFPKLDRHLLINATEKKSTSDIDRLVSAVRSLK